MFYNANTGRLKDPKLKVIKFYSYGGVTLLLLEMCAVLSTSDFCIVSKNMLALTLAKYVRCGLGIVPRAPIAGGIMFVQTLYNCLISNFL